LQSQLPVGLAFDTLKKNTSFLVKYGVLVLILTLNYALNKTQKQSAPKVIYGSSQNFSENNQKKIATLSSDNQSLANYLQ